MWERIPLLVGTTEGLPLLLLSWECLELGNCRDPKHTMSQGHTIFDEESNHCNIIIILIIIIMVVVSVVVVVIFTSYADATSGCGWCCCVFQLRSQCTLGPIKINHTRKMSSQKHWESLQSWISHHFYVQLWVLPHKMMLPAEWTWISWRHPPPAKAKARQVQHLKLRESLYLLEIGQSLSSYHDDLDCT